MKGTSFVASCVAAHSEKWSTSTPTISSSSRWPSKPITLGVRGGAGTGEFAGAVAGETVGVGVTEGRCAPASLMFAAAKINRQISKHPATLFCLIVFIMDEIRSLRLLLHCFGRARLLANFFEVGGGVGARSKAQTMFHRKRRVQLRWR